MNPFLFKIWGSTGGVRHYIIDAKIENWNRFKFSECFIGFIPQRWKFVEVFSQRGSINWWFAHHFRHCFILHRLCQPQSRHHVCSYIWLIYSQFVCSERANASSARLSPYFYLYNSTSNVRYFSAILISPLHCGHPFREAEHPPLSLKPELWKHIHHEAVNSLFAVVLNRMLCLLKGPRTVCCQPKFSNIQKWSPWILNNFQFKINLCKWFKFIE